MNRKGAWLLAVLLAVLCGIPARAAELEPAYVRTVFDQTNGLPTDEANAVLQTRDGYLWVGSYGGLLRFDGSEFHNFSTEGAIATPSIRCLFEDSAGRLWIGSSDAGVFVYENGVFTAVPCTKKNSYLSIRDFAEGRDGTIYVASTSGVCRVRSGLLVPYSNPYITGETAYALGIDRYGRLWCAMSTGKCAVMQDDRVLAMLDAELFFEDGSVISCLASDRANNIYLGTNGSVLAKVVCSGQRLDGTAFTVQTYEVTDAANHNRVGVTAEGDILVSGQQGFAWVTADGTQRDPHTGTSTDAVNCAALDSCGRLWCGTYSELGLVRYDTGSGELVFFNQSNGLGSTRIRVAFELRDGTVAVGTQDGLALIRGDKVVAFYDKDSGLETQSILCIVQAPDGTLLAGSAGGGIYALDKARILAGETPHATQYGTARGLTGSLRVNTCNYKAPDGGLYLATRNGVSVFDFREISAPMPPLVINSIRVDDRTYESPERLTLGSDARRMTIRFSALTYSGATNLCIGYQLVGFAQSQGLHRGQLAGGLDGKLRQSETQTVHVQDLPRFPQEPHQAANRQRPAGRTHFSGLAEILQAPAGRRAGRPHRSQEKAERFGTENRAKYPPNDRFSVQPRHAAHRAAHNKGAILYRRE